MRITNLVFDPDAFFESEAVNPGLIGPLIVVLTAALASVGSTLVVMSMVASSLDGSPVVNLIADLTMLISFLTGFFGVFVTWLAVSVIIYALARRLGHNREFRDVFKLIGWGFFPSIIMGLTAAYASIVVYGGVDFPQQPGQLNAFFEQYSGAAIFMWSRFTEVQGESPVL